MTYLIAFLITFIAIAIVMFLTWLFMFPDETVDKIKKLRQIGPLSSKWWEEVKKAAMDPMDEERS